MAKLAELNGYPCTRHVLDLAYVLELSNRQQANITTIYDNMKKAVMLWQEIVSIEKIANEGFKNKTITDSQIKQLIMKGSEVYGQLRYIHQLNTHLKMVDILTPKQINLYNNLRGHSPWTIANDNNRYYCSTNSLVC